MVLTGGGAPGEGQWGWRRLKWGNPPLPTCQPPPPPLGVKSRGWRRRIKCRSRRRDAIFFPSSPHPHCFLSRSHQSFLLVYREWGWGLFGCKGLDVGGGVCVSNLPRHLRTALRVTKHRRKELHMVYTVYRYFSLYKKYEILYSKEANCIYA